MPISNSDVTVGWICALPHELAASKAMLDEPVRLEPKNAKDPSIYWAGKIGEHNVVMSCLSGAGKVVAATAATNMLWSFPSLRFGLMVGIGGGAATRANDIRLGDVVVSQPTSDSGGVIQYDFGKSHSGNKFEQRGTLSKPPPVLCNAIRDLQAQHETAPSKISSYLVSMPPNYARPPSQSDVLYGSECTHEENTSCELCNKHEIIQRVLRHHADGMPDLDPRVHYGLIASGDRVIASMAEKDILISNSPGILCFEMEAAGLMDNFPCLVIRGISDYADSYKRDDWQRYAASTAAAYAKELLHTIPGAATEKSELATDRADPRFGLGLQWGQAYMLDQSLFVGRQNDLAAMETCLDAVSAQPIAILAGLGGIGKTQLALRYITLHQAKYTSIWCLDASSEITLKRSLVDLSMRVKELTEGQDNVQDAGSEDTHLTFALQWLSQAQNSKWLLLFDNYDDPDLPGIKSPSGYDIRKFFPYKSQGSIIVTTRSPRVQIGSVVPVQKMATHEDGFEILEKRSRRIGVSQDPDAFRLVQRLDGLPLALVAAGDYLCDNPDTFGQYLESYEKEWEELAEVTDLPDYESRALHSTWNVSFARLTARFPSAGQLLRLFAYFDHKDIWYELLHSGLEVDIWYERLHSGLEVRPDWFQGIVRSRIAFNSAVKRLQDYSFVDLNTTLKTYSLHTCVSDWALEHLNQDLDLEFYGLAVKCVGRSYLTKSGDVDWHTKKRLTGHGLRFASPRLLPIGEQTKGDLFREFWKIGSLLGEQGRFQKAEPILRLALVGCDETLGPDHEISRGIAHSLAGVCQIQMKAAEAQLMYSRSHGGAAKSLDLTSAPNQSHELAFEKARQLGEFCVSQNKLSEARSAYLVALDECEKAFGPNHANTFQLLGLLGPLCKELGNVAEAEQMLLRALPDPGLPPDSSRSDVPGIMSNLGNVYLQQGELVKAEQILLQAIEGFKEQHRLNHVTAQHAMDYLGIVYEDQNKPEQAQIMFTRSLEGFTEVLGPKHKSTLCVRSHLGHLLLNQGDMAKAREMFTVALEGFEEILERNDGCILNAVYKLAVISRTEGDLDAAETMYLRTLDGYEESKGSTYSLTLELLQIMGEFYVEQGKEREAIGMYTRVLDGYAATCGQNDSVTITTAFKLGLLYRFEENWDKAEEMIQRALQGFEEIDGALGGQTLMAVCALGWLYMAQGKLSEAEEMLCRALDGYEETKGAEHALTLSTYRSLEELGKLQNAGLIEQARQMLAAADLQSQDGEPAEEPAEEMPKPEG